MTATEQERWHRPSPRMTLRRHVVKVLRASRTLTGCRVWDNRGSRPDDADLPGINVLTKDEPAERFQDTPTAYSRRLTLWIDIYARAREGDRLPQDLVDVIAQQVEDALHLAQHEVVKALQHAAALGVDLGFALRLNECGLAGTTMDVDDEGNRLEAGARITWHLTYLTEVDEAQLTAHRVTPFEIAHVDWDLGPDGEIDGTDDIRPEQP